MLLLDCLASNALSVDDIRKWTDREPRISRVRSLILEGWPEGLKSEDLQPYYQKRKNLSVLDGFSLGVSRVVVPPQGRERVTEELHATHPGIVKMRVWHAVTCGGQHLTRILSAESILVYSVSQREVFR